jgi:C_GCAxxG_C_C family probable redox protein
MQMPVKVRPPYRKFSREELLQEAYALGAAYEINSYACSQCTVKAIHELVDIPDDLVKAATMNCAGTAFQALGTCGGLVGGIMVLDYFFGRPVEHMSRTEVIQDPNVADLFKAQAIAKKLVKKYFDTYGTINCCNIMVQTFGRVFWLEDMDDFAKLEAAGGHSDPNKAPRIVGTAARWVMEVLLDEGAVQVGE